jgi:hypothetical protein
MDFLMVVDADVVFASSVGEEILGETMGVLQSFFFGQDREKAPFETHNASSSFIPIGEGSCYYAGGVFGGTYAGFVRLLYQTTLLMEWDLAYVGHTASHDDESYLNKAFFLSPPSVSLGGNYIYPEPPADRAWGLKGVNWNKVFPPRLFNLGARKWLSAVTATDRAYKASFDSRAALDMLAASVPVPIKEPLTLGLCVALDHEVLDVPSFLDALVDSVETWYAADVQVIVVDTGASIEKLSFPLKSKTLVYVPLVTSGNEGRGCPQSALQRLLLLVKSSSVLLLDMPVVLTWQSYLPFLHEQLLRLNEPVSSVSMIVICSRLGSGPALQSTTRDINTVCILPSDENLARERAQSPTVSLLSPMRSLNCWNTEHVAGYGAVLLATELARSLTSPALPGACQSIDCLLDAGIAHQKAPGSDVQILSCLHGLQPIIIPIIIPFRKDSLE